MNFRIKKRIALFSVLLMVLCSITISTNAYAASGDTPVIITATGECYHTSGCRTLKKTRIESTMQDAVNKGLRACSVCNPGTIDSVSTAAAPAPVAVTQAAVSPQPAANVSDAIEALKTYKGNTAEFNAYAYYINNIDLQTAIGADGDKLLKHYTDFGKAEGRIAK